MWPNKGQFFWTRQNSKKTTWNYLYLLTIEWFFSVITKSCICCFLKIFFKLLGSSATLIKCLTFSGFECSKADNTVVMSSRIFSLTKSLADSRSSIKVRLGFPLLTSEINVWVIAPLDKKVVSVVPRTYVGKTESNIFSFDVLFFDLSINCSNGDSLLLVRGRLGGVKWSVSCEERRCKQRIFSMSTSPSVKSKKWRSFNQSQMLQVAGLR